jgi:[ribosomal protein S5]-alanine N-acetyltransferase
MRKGFTRPENTLHHSLGCEFISLESERLLLRPLRASDADALFLLHSDPLVVRLTTDGQAMTRQQSDDRLALYLREWTELRFGFFMVYERQPNGDLTFAGRCGLRSFNDDAVELGYCFAERASGRGIATEAARLVVDDAFARREHRKLVGLVRPTNLRSQCVLSKLGFAYVRALRHRDVDYHYYELRRDQAPDRLGGL